MNGSDSGSELIVRTKLARRQLLGSLGVVAVGAVLVGCGGGGTVTTTGGAAAQTGNVSGAQQAAQQASSNQTPAQTVTMNDQYRYVPDTIKIAKGATIEWKNTSASPHTVTCDPSKAANKADAELPSKAEPFDSGLIDPGKTFSHTFTEPGDYSYFCIPHESMGMLGKIEVTD